MDATSKCGLYGTDIEVFAVTPTGKVVVVASPDTDRPFETDGLPKDATSVDGMVTPDEAVSYWRAAEEVTGETLVETA